MKNKWKRFVRICSIIWGALVILTTVTDVIKYINGDYIKIDATITYVNQFEGNSRPGSPYARANGYLIWEHNEEMIEGDRLVDFPADAEVGDVETIWIDSETGEYLITQGLFYTLFGGAMHIIICALILKFVKIENPKKEVANS